MCLADEFAKLRRSFRVDPAPKESKAKRSKEIVPATTLPLDRPLTPEERAIGEWVLRNADPPALDFLPQLEVARVTGQCSCGCPTIDLRMPEGTPRVEPRENPVGDATGHVGEDMVGVMLLQRGGYLQCLEVYDLSDIQRPYGLPSVKSLEPMGGEVEGTRNLKPLP